MTDEIKDILKNIQSKLTIEGKKRIFEDGKELKYEDLKQRQNPEEFTREFLIDKILFDILKTERTGPKNFDTTDGTPRMVDYAVKFEKTKILIEAKPINANLYDKSSNAAVNQIIGVFRLAEARDKFDFGIATDGLKWVFISNEGNSEEYDIRKDFNEIKKRIKGEEKILQKKMEDISKKFYQQYNDLLHGVKKISKKDCLVNSILHVEDEEDREEIAQVVIDRLIFIKFLEAKGIIKEHVLDYLYDLEEHDLNLKLNQLFFEVMSTKEKERGSVDPHFKHIPYLNGSLFDKLDVEKRNSNYRIRSRILHKVIEFLNKFKFVHQESLDSNGDFIDPEILGYIFERAMNATDRKGTGAYYTPKEITRFIAEHTIYPNIIEKVNDFLIKNRGYKKSETIKKIDELFILRETTLNEIWNKIILELSICDNACGSGAFLLAAANVLFNLNKKINNCLGLRNSDVALKKLVLKSLYGVDINSRAVEIALLRLWLWLVESYKPENIEPLPNIEYNLRVGNSLIGYIDIEQFGKTKVSLDDFYGNDDTIKVMLINFRNLKNKYVKATGDDARQIRKKIDEIRRKIKQKLDKELYYDFSAKKIKITRKEFLDLKPFHWGFEFYEIFDLEKEKDSRGFDVIIGNPPYVRQELFKELKPMLKLNYDSYNSIADLYVYFIEHSLKSLSKRGFLSYITPNKFLKTSYGKQIRNYLRQNSKINLIYNFDDYQVFEDATNYPLIFIVDNNDIPKSNVFIYSKFNKKKESDLINTFKETEIKVPQKILTEDSWIFADVNESKLLEKIQNNSISLKSYVSNKIFRGISSGRNDVFIIDKRTKDLLIKDPKAKSVIKKIVTGKEVKRYNIDFQDRFLLFIPWDYDLNYSSSIKQYLLSKKEELEKRPEVKEGRFNWWCLSRYGSKNSKYLSEPKIIYPRINNQCNFCIDKSGEIYLSDNNFFISTGSKSLLALLNSKLVFFYLSHVCPTLRGGYHDFRRPFIEKIPINKNLNKYQEELAEKADKILRNPNNSKNIEMEIDKIIYEVYGLTKKEIEIIEKN